MKKNNKGFTLVELLAIILIIAIIGVIAVPNISNQMKKNEDRQQRLLNQRITNAAHTYAAKYYADKMVEDYTSDELIAEFTLSDLEQDGLLDLNKDECKNGELASATTVDNKITVSWDSGKNKISFDFDNIKTNGLSVFNCVDNSSDKNSGTGIYALW